MAGGQGQASSPSVFSLLKLVFFTTGCSRWSSPATQSPSKRYWWWSLLIAHPGCCWVGITVPGGAPSVQGCWGSSWWVLGRRSEGTGGCLEQGEAGKDLPGASSLQDIVFSVRCVPAWWGQGWCRGSGSGECWELGFGIVTSCPSWAVWPGSTWCLCEMGL